MATQAQLVTAIVQAMPYPTQLSFDLSEDSAVRFTWRGVDFRVSLSGDVEEVGNGVLISTDRAILVSALVGPALAKAGA
jgi:hypothetical protein